MKNLDSTQVEERHFSTREQQEQSSFIVPWDEMQSSIGYLREREQEEASAGRVMCEPLEAC